MNRYLSVLGTVLLMARDEWQWLDKVPKVKLVKEAPHRVRFLSHSEMAALFKELSKFQYMPDLDNVYNLATVPAKEDSAVAL